MENTLPKNPQSWTEAVREQSLETKTIHEIDLSSGSTIEIEQYLMLRVLRVWKKSRTLDLSQFNLKDWNQKAVDILHKSSSWKFYLASVSGKVEERTFALSRLYQEKVASDSSKNAEFRPNVVISPIAHLTRGQLKNLQTAVKKLSFATPSQRPSTPVHEPEGEFDDIPGTSDKENSPWSMSYGPEELLDLNFSRTKGEQIVNTALVDFLNAFIIHLDYHTHWSLYRKPFKASFESTSFVARTDGCLEDSGSKTYGIVEVKPMLRQNEDNRISMQEAVEIVAWITSESDTDGLQSSCGRQLTGDRRILISQDREEIYLTFAAYDASYIRYLNKALHEDEAPGFLTLHVFGPWNTTSRKHMEDLGSILLAIVLRAEFEEIPERSKA